LTNVMVASLKLRIFVLIPFCLIAPAAQAATPLHDGLIAYWPLAEGAGSIAFDAAPHGAIDDNGQLRNGPAWIDGVFEAGLQFSSSASPHHVLVPQSSDLDLAGPAVTLAAWVKLDETPAELSETFSSIYDSSTDNYILYLDKTNNELRFKVTTAGGADERPGVPAPLLSTGQWHHLMGVYDGAGHASIYFNGELIDVHSLRTLAGPVRAGQIAGIGAQVGAGVGNPPSSPFHGGVADVAVWNRALGAAEAQHLYDGGAGRAIAAANPALELIAPSWPGARSIIVSAHRGNSFVAPENTLAAINAAAGIADRTEFDIRVSRDGQLILMHDATVDRTTNGAGAVSSRDYNGDLDQLDAGSWFAPQFAGERIPTMAQAVQAALAAGVTPLIEHKAGAAAQYVNELNSLGVLDDVVIISFDWSFLSDVRTLDADVELGALGSGAISAATLTAVQAAGADFINWGDGAPVSAANIAAAHALGLEFHVWTVNSFARMKQLIELGVDGIATDDPALLRLLTPPLAEPTADFDADGDVDGADFLTWQQNVGATDPTLGDANGDGAVDHDDWLHWQATFGQAEAAAAVNIPEPSALSLVLLTVLGTARRRESLPKNHKPASER
jgi:glycerophosphoryl diester phosphodiesterase